MSSGVHRLSGARTVATRILAYVFAAALSLLAALVLSVELDLVMGFSGRPGVIADRRAWPVVWAVVLAWTILRVREPAGTVDRACRAGLVVSALFPLCLVVSTTLRRADWAELGGLALGLGMGFLLLVLSLVVNPGLCVVHLLAQRGVEGIPTLTGPSLPAGSGVAAYAALVVTCVLLARHAPFVLPATAAATAGGLVLMAWPRGTFALRAGVGLAGPYAPLAGAAALVAPVVTGLLWSVLARRGGGAVAGPAASDR